MHENTKKTVEVIFTQNRTCELPQFLPDFDVKARAILRTVIKSLVLLITNFSRGRVISYTNAVVFNALI